MDNVLPNPAAANDISKKADVLMGILERKRRRDGYSIEEDVKDNLKAQRQWFVSQRVEDVIAEGCPNNVHYQGLSMENLILMQQQQMSEAAATAPVVSSLNMQQRVMAAAALQDLRGINESSKVFFQPQLQQNVKYGLQQQQSIPQSLPQQVSKSDGSLLGELSPSCQPPQSPLPVPPAPFIRTPPLHSEADIHNGSPTSSSSGPYPSLPNMTGPPRTSQPSSAPIQLPEPESDSSYSSLLHTSQGTLLTQSKTKNGPIALVQAQQSTHSSSSGMSVQRLRGHSPQTGMAQQADQNCRGSNVHPGGPPSFFQEENGHLLDVDLSRQQAGHVPQNCSLQQSAGHLTPSGTQSSSQSGSAHHQNGHPMPNLLQNGMQNGAGFQHCSYTLPARGLQSGMQNGNIHQQGGQLLPNPMTSGAQSGNVMAQGDSPRVGAASFVQQGRQTMASSLHHQQSLHFTQNGLSNGNHNGMMHQRALPDGMVQHQNGHMPQTGMATQHPIHCTTSGIGSNQTVQGGSSGMLQQQLGLPPLLREIQGLQQIPGSWYPAIRDTSTASDTQPSVSTSRLQRNQDAMVLNSMGNTMFSTSVTDIGGQKGPTTAQPQLSQVQGGFRDFASDRDLHSHCDLQSPLQSIASGKGCTSPSNRMGKVLPTQTDLHGRRFLQGNTFCAPSSSGADMNLSSPAVVANGGMDDPALLQRTFLCPPPKFTRSYTKVYKLGSITRAVDVNRFSNYTELRCELARMFNLDGQLDQKLGWQLVFTDNEDDLLLVGDDPWEEFVRNVRGIRILTPAEVYYYTNEDKCTAAAYNSTGGSAPKQM